MKIYLASSEDKKLCIAAMRPDEYRILKELDDEMKGFDEYYEKECGVKPEGSEEDDAWYIF